MTPVRHHNHVPAMTLMETVIAIGVIAFAVPLVLAATAAGLSDRRNAESETRAAWLAGEVTRQIAARWATPPRPTYLPESLDTTFPVIATEALPWILLYDGGGNFLKAGDPQDLKSGTKTTNAIYLVTVHAVAHTPANLTKPNDELSRLVIQVQQPARASAANRQTYPFSTIMAESIPD
jgi:type II secretory pathway pseudopilin PulG